MAGFEFKFFGGLALNLFIEKFFVF